MNVLSRQFQTNIASTRRVLQSFYTFEYTAVTCRTHSASITEFGGVGDDNTLNTKAFQNAVDHLSQYSNEGGAQLFVPAGKWLTGSFNLTSHFTLFLHKDIVLLLAAQDLNEYPILKALPSYGRGRDAAGGRFASLIFGTNLSDVIITGIRRTDKNRRGKRSFREEHIRERDESPHDEMGFLDDWKLQSSPN